MVALPLSLVQPAQQRAAMQSTNLLSICVLFYPILCSVQIEWILIGTFCSLNGPLVYGTRTIRIKMMKCAIYEQKLNENNNNNHTNHASHLLERGGKNKSTGIPMRSFVSSIGEHSVKCSARETEREREHMNDDKQIKFIYRAMLFCCCRVARSQLGLAGIH